MVQGERQACLGLHIISLTLIILGPSKIALIKKYRKKLLLLLLVGKIHEI